MNRFVERAKAPYRSEKLARPDWTVDTSRPNGPLWLNKNENIDPVLNAKIRALISHVPNTAINTYPETAKIYKKLAALDALKPTQFLLTPGSDGAIRAVFDVFIEPGDRVLHTSPTFAMYDVYCKMFGAEQLAVSYEHTAQGPVLNTNAFFAAAREHQPKLICLPNPDSPTGTVLSGEALDELLSLSLQTGSLLLIDEAYFPFYPKTVLPKIQMFPNLLVARSFSKAWGAAGLRVGYLAGETELIALLHKNRPMYEISTFSVEVLNLLLDCAADVEQSVERLHDGKTFFINEMKTLGFTPTHSFGNFVHVDFADKEKQIARALKDTVLYRTDFAQASCLRGFSRFSLATREQFAVIVAQMKKGLQ